MPIVVVANPKGGVGKSTTATHVAGYWARQGQRVMLGDVDRQQSSKLWLGLRPDAARPINSWEVASDTQLKAPKGTTHVVLDTPAGLHGKRLVEVMKLADKLLIPLQPSIFDIYATRSFLDQLLERRKVSRLDIGVIGMRVDARTRAASQLQTFVETLGLPVLGYLRDTQRYVQLAARGLTLFDVSPQQVSQDLAQWQSICDWLDR